MAPNESGLAQTPLKPPPTAGVSHVAPPLQYEFGRAENTLLSNLGSKLSFIGLFILGIGIVLFISEMMRWMHLQLLEVVLLVFAVVLIPIGIWTYRAGREFRRIAVTEGKDITHLMDALSSLLRLCTLVYIFCFTLLIFAVIQVAAMSLYGG